MILLADYAQLGAGNKFNALGIGWTKTSSPLSFHSLILLVDVNDDEVDQPHELILQLVDQTGEIVPDRRGGLVEANAEVRVQLEEGTTVPGVSMAALTLAPGLSLAPGVYTWEARSPSAPNHVWKRRFEVFEDSVSLLKTSTAS